MRWLLGLALLLSGCVSGHWTATYVVQGQEYQENDRGTACPATRDVSVGHTSGSLDTGGHWNYGETVYMKGNLKAGTCQVQP